MRALWSAGAVALLSGACRPAPAAKPTPAAPAAATPPATSPRPPERPAVPPVTEYAGTMPKQIPRQALAYRDNFIRIWRFFFNLAETPTIGFSQVHQESRWDSTAHSAFASGLAQFTPATAADYSRLLPAEVRARCPSKAGCPTSPNWALNALALYDFNLRKQITWAETDDDHWRLALAAYNGGLGWLVKERVKANGSGRWADIADACMRKKEFCEENRNYPVVILEKWFPIYRKWLGL